MDAPPDATTFQPLVSSSRQRKCDIHDSRRTDALTSETTDSDAFARFYHTHAPRVYMLALRLCRDPDQAGEVLSETFVRAWRGLPRFRGDSTAGTWLHTIAVRAWRDIRRARGHSGPIIPEHRMDNVQWSEYDIAAQYDEPAARIDMEHAIATLPDGAREVIILFAISGYSQAEIATMLDISVGTVKSQLHRARKLLLERLSR